MRRGARDKALLLELGVGSEAVGSEMGQNGVSVESCGAKESVYGYLPQLTRGTCFLDSVPALEVKPGSMAVSHLSGCLAAPELDKSTCWYSKDPRAPPICLWGPTLPWNGV